MLPRMNVYTSMSVDISTHHDTVIRTKDINISIPPRTLTLILFTFLGFYWYSFVCGFRSVQFYRYIRHHSQDPAGHGGRNGVTQVLYQGQHASSGHRLASLLRRTLEKIYPNGKTCILSDGEGRSKIIESMEPLDEEISGIMEVGRVTAKVIVTCASYGHFEEGNPPFELGLGHEAVKIVHESFSFFLGGYAIMVILVANELQPRAVIFNI